MNNDQPLLKIIQDYLESEDARLPVFDPTAREIHLEAEKDEPDNLRIEKLISNDPYLTSQVLRIANSAFFVGLQKITTVRNAIVRLGSRKISDLAFLECQKKQFCARDPNINRLMQQLWKHSAGCALSAQWLAGRSGLDDLAQEAFTAGLLHDIGKLLILKVTDALNSANPMKQATTEVLLLEVLENFHTEYGEKLLRHWDLPDVYSRIAKDHHVNDPGKENLLLLVRLANKVNNSLGIGLRGVENCMLAATPEASHFGLSEIALAELEVKLEDMTDLW